MKRILLLALLTLPVAYAIGQNSVRAEKSTSTIRPTNSKAIEEFARDVDGFLSDPLFADASWGVVVQSVETGEYLFKRNESKNFLPASTLKIFTTSSALNYLSPEFRYTTALFIAGSQNGEVVKGDIVIRGTGDPTFGTDDEGATTGIFDQWADSLVRRGVKEITGNIIGDDNYFDDVPLAPGWQWDDLSYDFCAEVSALSFHRNAIDVSIKPGIAIGASARVEIFPQTKYISIVNNVTTARKDSAAHIEVVREPGTNLLHVRGTIPVGGADHTEEIAVTNPTLFTAALLKEALERRGVKVGGAAVDIDDVTYPLSYDITQPVASTLSPRLGDIITKLTKESINLYAELLVKTMGREFGREGSWTKGLEMEKKFLSEAGLSPERLSIVDGSGLSRLDLISAQAMTNLLRTMYSRPAWKTFYNALPIAGIDGTLKNRMKDTRAQANVHAKTGFLTGARALAGYALTANNELVAFTIFANNFTAPVSVITNVQDLICMRLVNFSRK